MKYIVTLNNNQYEVVVDQDGVSATTVTAPKAVAPAPVVAAPAPAPVAVVAAPVVAAPAPVAAAPVAVKGEDVLAPIPGTVCKIVATVGTTVKEGDILVIIEAMKMENEIVASRAGTVLSVIANASVVTTGDVLAVLG